VSDDLRDLGGLLHTAALGRVHEHHDTIGSTNARAAAWAEQGAPHGALVTAEAQTAGRGRRGRSWVSPPGQLYASVVVRPPAATEISALGLAVGVALREGLPECGVGLKWPNDLWLVGRKLGGILCEARWHGTSTEAVVGFGINLRRVELPADLAETSVFLEDVEDAVPPRAVLLASLLRVLETTLACYFEGGFEAIRTRYEPHSVVLGHAIDLDDPRRPGHRRRVLADAFDRDGALLVRSRPGGAVERVESADVWLRPG
jgi:BirA family transcriptional regulator, biotin operon repressor / biotin---[acetyl-CoA-carboxylase] ligase